MGPQIQNAHFMLNLWTSLRKEKQKQKKTFATNGARSMCQMSLRMNFAISNPVTHDTK